MELMRLEQTAPIDRTPGLEKRERSASGPRKVLPKEEHPGRDHGRETEDEEEEVVEEEALDHHALDTTV